jgi:hypothetical protein
MGFSVPETDWENMRSIGSKELSEWLLVQRVAFDV